MISFFSHTDIGTHRERNEDFFMVLPENSSEKKILKSEQLFLIGDGMGGHPAGDVASNMACNRFKELYFEKRKAYDFIPPISFFKCIFYTKLLKKIFFQIDRDIYSFGNKFKQCKGLGTTLSVLLITKKKAIIAHVGDSRIYRLHKNKFDLLTKDHTLIQEFEDMGKSLELNKRNSLRHVLTQALGMGIEYVYTWCGNIKKNELFLLCTDGLHDSVSELEIRSILSLSLSLQERGRLLIQKAKENGSKDNITVIIVSS